jgi:hypothetical protein
MMADPPRCPDYAAIKELAAKLGRPASTLIALTDDRDPFYVTPARLGSARWFARVWAVLDPPAGVHLRRLHYRFVSLPADQRPPKLDGSPYENTERDWKIFSAASADARALGLVDAALFTDRRAGEPIFVANDSDRAGDTASVFVFGGETPQAPRESAFGFYYAPKEYALPPLGPSIGVIAPRFAEPYALEIWAEKSTMNDVLEPMARRLNVTLIAGVGELSQTHCVWHVNRVLAHHKPTRILYVSDHDPSGDRMPVSVARKIEYLLRRDGHDLDNRLDPLVLTREQVERYRLPRIPIKDSDKGKRNFEERHAEGAVELDALEALHPGELGRIAEEAIARYRDPTRRADQENEAIAAQANADCRRIRQDVLTEFAARVAELGEAFEAMRSAIEPRQEALAAIAAAASEQSLEHVEAINAETEAFYQRAAELRDRIAETTADRTPDADEFEWVSPTPADEGDDALFDSSRSYLEQIDRYKAQLGQPTNSRRPPAKERAR